MNADGTGQTRLTENSHISWQPTWSPDGTRIAFASERDGDSEIYVMNADGTGQTRLTDTPSVDYYPSWSPDGTKIAFASGRDFWASNDIYVMNADGTGQTRLTTNSSLDDMPSWSPDGTKIAFINDRTGNNQIYVMNADGTGQTRLTTDEFVNTFPTWSPDGSKIAYARSAIGGHWIVSMNADGTGQADLNSSGSASRSWAPSWQALPPASSDGTDPAESAVRTSDVPLPPAAISKPYTARLVASGGTAPYSWAVTDGELPEGLSLTEAGTVSGTPTALGSSWFGVTVTDAKGEVAEATYCIAVSPMAVSTLSLPDAYAGKSYAQTLTAVGASGQVSWSATGSLPPGLRLGPYGNLAGTPAVAGTYTFTVKARDAAGKTAAQRLTLRTHPMTVVTGSFPDGLAGAPYPTTRLQVLGGRATHTWSVVSGSLPAGLRLSAGGYVTGTPAGPGSSTFTVKVTDASVPKREATRTLSIDVAPMTVTTTALPISRKGVWYSTYLKATGGRATRTWSLVAGTLPPGLRLTLGGAITGRPTTSGSYGFTVQVADASVPKNVARQELSILVE
ncbi:putative Ig domain-containing protein [Nocardioides sp. R1-1]|uniref:putative Ig domain-containing protein n=1 Tax=Nocardioides sp. R1-1 TaxID=3383502 RepID=UPI0038D076BD